jgi:hypothetical protein
MKRVVAWLGAVGLGFAGCVGYPAAKLAWANHAVDAFCASVEVGAPVAGLEARALAASLRTMSLPERPPERAKLVAWEGFAFARRFCDVEHERGLVTTKRSSSLD